MSIVLAFRALDELGTVDGQKTFSRLDPTNGKMMRDPR
jgi:hypothetical protein